MAEPNINIEDAANDPKSASSPDGMSATGHSLPDLIAADKYLRARAAASDRRNGVRFAKIVPPGSAGSGETR